MGKLKQPLSPGEVLEPSLYFFVRALAELGWATVQLWRLEL